MHDDPAQALETLVERVRVALADPSAIKSDADGGPSVGEAADGMVHAEVEGERVTVLRLDPRLLRQPLEDVAAEIVRAVNAALAARVDRPDTSPLLAELRSVQEQSVVEMRNLTQAFGEALRRATPSS